VSDFFSRLAARAVGDAPEARPARGLDVSQAPVAAPARSSAAPPVVRATPAAPEVRSELPEAPVEQPVEAEPVAQHETRREELGSAETAAPVERARTPARSRADERTEPALTQVPATPAVVPATPVAAAPIVRRVAETRLQRIHSVATVAADEPPVRVHIGRLEVRANLEQPAPQPRAEKAKSEGLSLGEYLRGKRPA
jgi:hypothetical protein